MKNSLESKRGATTVFICMILSAILLVVAMFGEGAAGLVSRPYANAVLDLAGRSIISEYDRDLKSRYELFGFLMDDEIVEDKLYLYTGESLAKRKKSFSLLSLEIREIKVDSSSFAMTNLDILENQIVGYMKHQIVMDSLTILDQISLRKDEEEVEIGDIEKRPMRTLRNSKVIDGLPSRLLKGSTGGLRGIVDLPKPSELGKIAYKDLCLNRYIQKHFRHDLDDPDWDDTFFTNEIEYVIGGSLSDSSNRSIVYLSLLAFRTAINTSHIYLDENKMELVTAAAALVGAGVGTGASQAIIIGLWAGAEAAVDIDRLYKGEKLPLVKSSEDWHLSLDKALDGIIPENNDLPQSEQGLDYEDYLFLLLCFKSRESKLIRIMDLIQLNLQACMDKNFAMVKCRAGFDLEAVAERNKGFPGIISLRKGVFTASHVY